MSAIWGCVNLEGGTVSSHLCETMRQPFLNNKIDRYSSQCLENAFMGCGIQYIHRESPNEPLPILDEQEGLLFTADAHIYNRDELIGTLCAGKNDIPDGELFFLAYKKWKKDVSKHVYGSYAYAAYDKRQNELTVAADHTSTRSIYYCRHEGKVFFSTLAEPINCGIGKAPEFNEEWAALFLAMTTYSILVNPTDTPYKDIYRVTAAHYMVFTKNDEKSVEYWSPDDVRPLVLKNDDEYRERFRALMQKCMGEMLRIDGEMAIMLSSGLDSSSVAAFAAPILSGQGKTLHSYTHVPIDSFEKPKNSRLLYDERSGVLRLCEMYPNIIPRFLSTPDRNAILSLSELMNYGIFPIKSTTNIAWIDALMEEAANDGCRAMLTGQYGNTTISLGSMETYLLTSLSQGRFFNFWTSLRSYSKNMGFSRKRIIKYLASQLVPVALKKMMTKDYLDGTLLDRDFASKAGIEKKDSRLEFNLNITPAMTFQAERKYVYNNIAFAHICDSETKLSLRYGMNTLDVTKDIRIIEFCLSLPLECFVRPIPETRRLCRVYLSDLLPEEILPEKAPRGSQSADMIERLVPCWEEAYKELRRVCLSPRLLKMLDEQSVKSALDQLEDVPTQEKSDILKKIIYAYSMGIFLENHSWQDV